MREFDLILDSNMNDNLLATIKVAEIGGIAKLEFAGEWPTDGSQPRPNQLTLEISKEGSLISFVYTLVVADDQTFIATANTALGALPAPMAILTGEFISSTGTLLPDRVRIDQILGSSTPSNSVAMFAIHASEAGIYNILLNGQTVDTLEVITTDMPVFWMPPESFEITDGNYTLTVVPDSAEATGAALLSIMGGSKLSSVSLKMVAVKDLPVDADNDTAYYLLHDTQQTIIDAGVSGSVLDTLVKNRQILGVISQDGTPPADGSNMADPLLTLANNLQLPILAFDQEDNSGGGSGGNGGGGNGGGGNGGGGNGGGGSGGGGSGGGIVNGIHFWASTDKWGMNNIQGTKQDDDINADALGQANNALTSRDWISGGAGNDTIAAGSGGDDIRGGEGNDKIDGGGEQADSLLTAMLTDPKASSWELENRVHFSGPSSRYSISEPVEVLGVLTYTVTDNRTNSPDGTDTVSNVDVLQFSDKQIRLTPSIWVDRGWDPIGSQPGTTVKGVYIDGTSGNEVIGADDTRFAGSDRLVGNAGNDTLYGGAGADTFRGDKGNDQIDGGANRSDNADPNTWDHNGSRGLDVAEYSGPASRYTIREEGGTFTVTDAKGAAGDGTDTLTNVEILRFADGEKNLAVVKTAQMQYSGGPTTGTVIGYNWEGTELADTIATQPQGASPLRDWVNSGAGNDKIATGGAGDWIDAGEGDDTVDGGDNGNSVNSWENKDQVRYDAPISRFSITQGQDSEGTFFTVTDALPQAFGGYGTDKLYNIEVLQFNDGNKELNVQFDASGYQNNVQGTDFEDHIDTDALLQADLAKKGSNTLKLKAEGQQALSFNVEDFTPMTGITYVAKLGSLSYFFNPQTQTQERSFQPAMQWDPLQMRHVGIEFDVIGQSDGTLSGTASLSSPGVWGTPVLMLFEKSANNTTPITNSSVAVAIVNERDWVQSQAGDDVVLTGAGGDTIEDSAGNDIYDAGANGNSATDSWNNIDRVNFSGAQIRYTIEVLSYADLVEGSAIRKFIDQQYPNGAPANLVRVTDKVPGGDGVNYLMNVEQLQFNGSSLNLSYNVNPWQPSPGGINPWVGSNHYEGGLLDDLMDATDHDAVTVFAGVNGFYSNKDWMRGNAGNDTLLGGNGGDELIGGAGDDLLDGGPNASPSTGNNWDDADRARYDNISSRYEVSFFRLASATERADENLTKYNEKALAASTLVTNSLYYVTSPYYVAEGLVVVQDKVSDAQGGDGRDVLKNIELLNFSDTSEWLMSNISTQAITGSQALQYNSSGSRYGDKLVGETGQVNWMDGRGGHDLLVGSTRNDTLTGGVGNDTLMGGAGTDNAKLAAPLIQFTLQRFEDVTGLITGTVSTVNAPSYYFTSTHKISQFIGGLGTDTLVGVEKLQFSDTTIDLSVRAEVSTKQGDQFFWVGGSQINTEKKFLGTLFDDTVRGRTPESGTAQEQFIMYAGDDTVFAGNGGDYVDAGEGNDYIELGNDPYTSSTSGPIWRDIARLGPGNDTVIGGTQTDSEVSDFTLNVPSGTQFVVANTLDGIAKYYTDTQWDIVRYDDDASRYTVELREQSSIKGVLGNLVATYQPGTVSDFADFEINADVFRGGFVDANNAHFAGAYTTNKYGKQILDYNQYVVVVRDSLPDHLGGDGVDVLLGIDSIAFEGWSLYLNRTSSNLSFSGPSEVVPETLSGYNITTSADGSTRTLTATNGTPAGTFATIVAPTPGYIDGKRGNDNLTGTNANDSIQGWAGDDLINSGAGDDYIVGGIGNDTINGGADLRADSALMASGNTFKFGDVSAYKNSLPVRFEIRKLVDDALGTVTGMANKVYYRVVDTASLKTASKADGYLTEAALSADNLKTGLGFGVDILIDVEHIKIGDTTFTVAPGISNYKSSFGADRSYIGGTMFDDVLQGTTHGDELDGREGNDTLDGGVEATGLPGNEWDRQDEVKYTGDRERFDVRGVMVQIGGTETNKTYKVLAGGETAEAGTKVLNGIQVTDLLPAAVGGSGTDLLVNIERLVFNSVPFNIVPRINEYEDMSAEPIDGLRPKSVNATGTDFADRLEGKTQSDWLSGGRGDDMLVGGAGGDNLEGGAGNDTLDGGLNGVIDQWGNVQTDTAQYKAPFERFSVSTVMVDRDGDGIKETQAIQVQDSLLAEDSASLGTDILLDVENISFSDRWVDLRVGRWEWSDDRGLTSGSQSGTPFDDTLTGDTRKNGELAAGQSDNLNGNAGHDVLLGGSGGDQLNGGSGNDVLDGGENGNSGDSWRNQDHAYYSGKQNQYTLLTVDVRSTASGNYTISINGHEAAKSVAQEFTITDTTLSDDVIQVLSLANQSLDLADGQHSRGILVVDKLSADLGGEGSDLVFNVENFGFKDGQLEIETRINFDDWNRDGQLDWVNATGTTSADVLTFDKIVIRTGKTADVLEATPIDIDLRSGDDVYWGGAGGESIRTGAGNDFVDGGANTGLNAWGGEMRDEVRFEGKFSRYVLIDVSLSKSDNTWSVSSSKGLTYTVGSGDAITSNNSEIQLFDASDKLSMGKAIDAMIAQAGKQNDFTGWIVADRLPSAFQGTGVDGLMNVEAISFSDKWMPLNMQVFYQRAPDSFTITSAHVDGTSRDDIIGYDMARSANLYNYEGDDHLRGNEGDDNILGGNGADWIEGGVGNDTIDGGADGTDPQGNVRGDTVRYTGDFDRYTITSVGGTVTVTDSMADDGEGTDTLTNIEGISFKDLWLQLGMSTWINRDMKDNSKIIDIHVRGSMLSETIDFSTSETAYQIWGNQGDDSLVGGSGPDHFDGGAGDDSIIGGANGLDAWGNPGVDVVRYEGSYGRYTIEYSVDAGATWSNTQPATGTILIKVTDSWSDDDGGAGTDLLSGIEAISFWDRYVMLETLKTAQDLNGDGVADVVEVLGTASGDTLTGDNTNDRLLGEAGDDDLLGGAGGDWLHGGAGDDLIDGGGNGIDSTGRVLYDVAAYDNAFSTYTITLNNGAGFTVTSGMGGNEGTDSLTGVEGLQFADRFISLVIDRRERDLDKNGTTDLVEVRGLDLQGSGDSLTFDTGKQSLPHAFMGGLGDDVLTGGDAVDMLEGGGGNDMLFGGQGVDRARFSGKFADYDIETIADLTTVTHKLNGPDGVDSLQGVEELVFADRSYRLGVQSINSQDVDTDGDNSLDKHFLSGTDASDNLVGSVNLPNVIDAGSGNDVITGGDRGDDITPGTGDDHINGGSNTGLNAAGNPNIDRVFYRSKMADNTVSAWQKASFTLSGTLEVGDLLSVKINSKTITHTAGSDNLATEVTAFAKTIATAIGRSIGDFSATSTNGQISLLGKGLFAVSPAVINGDHTLSGNFAVSGASQTGRTLVVGNVENLDIGMSVSYSAGSIGAETTYGPFLIEAINTSDNSLTLSDNITNSPSNGASLKVTQTNFDTTTATTEVVYERWHEVSLKDGTETDILNNVEQLLFTDSAVQLSFVTKQVNVDGQMVTAFTGTSFDDLLISSSAQEVFAGLGGSDRFVLAENSGSDVIKDFTPGAAGDVLTLLLPLGESNGFNSTGIDSVDAIMAQGVQRGTDTVIDLGAGNEVKLIGVTLSELSAANFELLSVF